LLYKLLLFLTLVGIFSIPISVDEVFGHGGGGDVAPPVSFQGKDVTVSTTFSPSDITVGEVDKATITMRFFDATLDENINDVTYQIELWRGGDLLARNIFFDVDGELNIDIKPISDCSEKLLWKCTKYFGDIHPVAGGLYTFGTNNPQIKGPIFVNGGLYYIRVDIIGATSPQTLLANPLFFELFVSIAEEFDFEIPTAQAEPIPVVIKTYYDDVSNFKFENSDNSISFDMPFNWDPNYISQVQVVHEEIKVPKSFSPYKEGSIFNGYVDGVQVDSKVIIIDPFSDQNNNIVHFMVSQKELKRINDVLGPSHYDKTTMLFKLVPQGELQKKSIEIKFDSGATVKIAWDSSLGAGDEIPFEFTFFNENGNLLKDIRYGYSVIDENDIELITNVGNDPINPGIMAMEGIDTQKITLPSKDLYRMEVLILGQGISNVMTYAGIGSGIIEVGPGVPSSPKPETPTPMPPSVQVPSWIQTTAGFWVDGFSSDDEFVNAIEFLIKERVIVIPPTASGGETAAEIPSWIKTTTGYWVDGFTSDKEFVTAIQWLIENDIMRIT